MRQSKDPTVKAVLSEDSTDLIGLLFAAVGITLAEVTGQEAWDAGAAILVGLLLVGVAIQLGKDTKGLLIGEAAPEAERERLRRVIAQPREIEAVRDLRTMYVGPESLLVAARVDLDDSPGAARRGARGGGRGRPQARAAGRRPGLPRPDRPPRLGEGVPGAVLGGTAPGTVGEALRRHCGDEVARVVVVRDLPRPEAAELVLPHQPRPVGHGVRIDVADERPAVQGRVVEPRRLRRPS